MSHFLCIAEQKILPAIWLELCSTPFYVVWWVLFVFKSRTNFSLRFYFPSVPLYSANTAFVFMEKVFSSLFYFTGLRIRRTITILWPVRILWTTHKDNLLNKSLFIGSPLLWSCFSYKNTFHDFGLSSVAISLWK